MFFHLRCVLLVILCTFALPAGAAPNIILFIGDGMGLSQISAARIQQGQLHMATLQHQALVDTDSATGEITDSAAAATAMATGVKTLNKQIGVDIHGKPLKTIMDHAKQQGMSIGLVATSRLTHATPAAFAAHVLSRGEENEIALQMAQQNFDVLFGGGKDRFFPQNHPESSRSDEENPLSFFQNYHKAYDARAFFELRQPPALALLAKESLANAENRVISLEQMTAKALSLLNTNPKGFVLMVEASQIDWAGHDNNTERVIAETIDLDKAVATAINFATQSTNTLIIVTGDHETGGMTIEEIEGKEIDADFTTTHHTGTLIPLFASGPGSEKFSGIIDNSDIGKILINLINQP